MPGDPYALFINPIRLTPEQLESIKRYWGAYDPQWLKLLKYIYNLLRWDFGRSTRNYEPVGPQMLARIPWTLLLIGGSTLFSIVIGVFLGVLVAYKRGGAFDTFNVTASLIVGSLPTFWMGLVFILIFSKILGWFPPGLSQPPEWGTVGFPNAFTVYTQGFPNIVLFLDLGGAFELLRGYSLYAFLPILTLTLFQYGGFLLLTRATMIEVLTEDYIVTARAKGLNDYEVLFRHALKNASLPIITSVALSFGFILSGAIITETVYSYPGLGKWLWDAINTNNYPVLMADFYVIALCVIIAVFVADLIYGIVDPRIHYG
jgi:peptide/nickel transport system permease protein